MLRRNHILQRLHNSKLCAENCIWLFLKDIKLHGTNIIFRQMLHGGHRFSIAACFLLSKCKGCLMGNFAPLGSIARWITARFTEGPGDRRANMRGVERDSRPQFDETKKKIPFAVFFLCWNPFSDLTGSSCWSSLSLQDPSLNVPLTARPVRAN